MTPGAASQARTALHKAENGFLVSLEVKMVKIFRDLKYPAIISHKPLLFLHGVLEIIGKCRQLKNRICYLMILTFC